MEHIDEELAALRKDWNLKEEDEMAFYTRILGGSAVKKDHGVIAIGVTGFARGGLPKDWCAQFSWPPTLTFHYSRYGMMAAHTLAREYCRRSDFFLLYLVLI